MPQLTTLASDTELDQVLEVLDRDGALILRDARVPEQVVALRAELMPYIEATLPGQEDFAGRMTTRTGALVSRSPACRELVMHPTMRALADATLLKSCEAYQLHLTQAIRIMPGQPAQPIHRDRWAWGTHLPNEIEPLFSMIWAVTDFTAANGATQVVPGSHRWSEDRRPQPNEVAQAEMPAGSVLLYNGTVHHGGGANVSDSDRIGLLIMYSLGWLRQEENQYLSTPPDIARTLDPELARLVGYQLGQYALGYYSPPEPPGQAPEVITPEYALHGQGQGSSMGIRPDR